MNLFEEGAFTLHSGGTSKFRINCEELKDKDLSALALLAVEIVGPFRMVIPILRGGNGFAHALLPHKTKEGCILICDDVYTTGSSFREYEGLFNKGEIKGICIFARREITIPWVQSIFTFNPSLKE